MIPDEEKAIQMPPESQSDLSIAENKFLWNEIINEELIDKLCATIKLGVDISVACSMHGITKATFQKWIRVGTDEIKRVENLKTQMKTLSQYANGELASKKVHKRAKPYVSMVFKVQKCLSDCEVMGVIGIKKAAMGSPAEFAKDRNGEIILDDRGKPIQLKAERAANWFAWAWFMERRFPERWSRTDVRDFDMERPEPTLAQGADLDRIRSADKELKELEQFEKRQAKGLPEPIEAEYSVENE